MSSGVVDENPSHHLRGDAEKVRAILPRDAALANQAQVRLVDERGRFECVVSALTPQVPGRQTTKLAVDKRHQLLVSAPVTTTPGDEQAADQIGLAGGRGITTVWMHGTPRKSRLVGQRPVSSRRSRRSSAVCRSHGH
jgi:hypothetical protein